MTITGVYHPEGYALCIDCAHAQYSDDWLVTNTSPIYNSTETDYVESCDKCHCVIDTSVLDTDTD